MAFQVEGAYQGRAIAKSNGGGEASKFLPSLYFDPPLEDIALEEFEELAIDRLRGEWCLHTSVRCFAPGPVLGIMLTSMFSIVP